MEGHLSVAQPNIFIKHTLLITILFIKRVI